MKASCCWFQHRWRSLLARSCRVALEESQGRRCPEERAAERTAIELAVVVSRDRKPCKTMRSSVKNQQRRAELRGAAQMR